MPLAFFECSFSALLKKSLKIIEVYQVKVEPLMIQFILEWSKSSAWTQRVA